MCNTVHIRTDQRFLVFTRQVQFQCHTLVKNVDSLRRVPSHTVAKSSTRFPTGKELQC